jgi:hypothetical protein
MTEEFLHYIWKHSLFKKKGIFADTGDKIEILNPGKPNTNAGPDFLNSIVRIGNTKWAGNVEIHISSSDWIKHEHNNDGTYDNVILHAVLNNDQTVRRTNGETIPTIELKFRKSVYNMYSKLVSSELWIPCENNIGKINETTIELWLDKLSIERMECKTRLVYSTLENTINNWEETFYIHLARNFGFNVNSLPFEMLAKSLPVKCLLKHKNNLMQIEALLFGQAGFLNDVFKEDQYYGQLKKEYRYLQRKFMLNPISHSVWRFLRLRPRNFPTIRIAQFAALIYRSTGLFSRIISCESIPQLKQNFEIKTSAYWNNHYIFGKVSEEKPKYIGKHAFQTIVINTIVPVLFAYARYKGREELKERALRFLAEIPAENNGIIRKWAKLGIISKNAFYSQALLQLKNEYCNFKKCLKCRIGSKIITTAK